ncbi:cytochrome P450 6j1-like [Cydia amplana]|uniref:cytochrome P450 6j1-like n=1 Tax=Cydia amplana TaxID=1869771 RepID=UPI002FE579E4
MWLYIALALIALVYYVFKSLKYDHWEKKGVPTASGNERFFGHFILVKKHLIEFYEAMYKEFPDAPLIGYYMMCVPALVVKDMDIIKTILISEFSSFNFNGFTVDKNADPIAAAHPFVLKGEEWKSARAQVTPSLSLAKLKGYLPSILKVGDEMVKYVKKNCVGTAEFEARKLSMLYATDVIGSAFYGIENNSFENKDSLLSLLTNELHFETTVFENIKQFIQRMPIINKFFPARFASQKLTDVMVAITRKVVKERLATGEKRNDLIQLLLTQKENDTKGGSVVEALLLVLCYYFNSKPNFRFAESFRLFSFFLSRECTSDCYVPMPGSEPFKITKGTPIVIPAGAIHKDPKYYPDPDKFDPERFTEEEVAKRPRFAFMPFGDGPKKCIGARLVTLHIKAAIIKILDNFRLTPSPKTKYPFEIDQHYILTFKPKGGTWVNFEPITQ